MSVKVMGMIWDMEIKRDLKFILLAYADHAEHNGEMVYPSIGLIAWKTGYSVRQIQRYTKELVDLKILIPQGDSRLGTNLYKIDLEKLTARPPYESKKGKPGRPPQNNRGDAHVTPIINGGDKIEKGGDKMAKGGDIAMSPDSSFKPSFNPSSVENLEQKKPRSPDDIREDVKRSYQVGLQSHLGKSDLSNYPNDILDILQTFCDLWHIQPPRFSRKGKTSAAWIESGRDLLDSCGEFGVAAIVEYRKDFEGYMRTHNGVAPHTVCGPSSLVNMVRAKAGKMREKVVAVDVPAEALATQFYTDPKTGRKYWDGEMIFDPVRDLTVAKIPEVSQT